MRIKFFQQRASTFIGLGRQSLVLHEHAVHNYLSNAVTWGPKILDRWLHYRKISVIDLITKVVATLNNFDSSKFHEEDN